MAPTRGGRACHNERIGGRMQAQQVEKFCRGADFVELFQVDHGDF